MASLRLSVAALAAAVAGAQAPCCAYGGAGAATMIADGLLVLPGPGGAPGSRASLATVSIGAGVSGGGDGFLAVLVGAQQGQGPESSFAGWSITQNATGQTLTAWYGANAGAGAPPPMCLRSSVAFPDFFTPSVKLCCGGGGNGGAFADFIGGYSIGSQRANWFGQNGTRGAMLSVTADAACAPVTMLGPDTPLGGGAFSFAVQAGSADSAPAGWAEAPAACVF